MASAQVREWLGGFAAARRGAVDKAAARLAAGSRSSFEKL
jgi:hypothetical protein